MDTYSGPRRVVLNLKYRPAPADFSELEKEVRLNMQMRKIEQVIYIDPDGETHYFYEAVKQKA